MDPPELSTATGKGNTAFGPMFLWCYVPTSAAQPTASLSSVPVNGQTHTLVELPVAAPGHGRVVPPVHLSDVVALDVGDLVHRQIASEGHLRQ